MVELTDLILHPCDPVYLVLPVTLHHCHGFGKFRCVVTLHSLNGIQHDVWGRLCRVTYLLERHSTAYLHDGLKI